ncbi:MAG: ATPase [Peptoniphilaceae bacterium]|nr:ATPase [Peptoniphilaceae bacterium]MCI6659654.1 ATPase [Peptoniphilaceae bacterium]MDD7433589.1 ATPase [Peptoniphilaceae bacterium]MDD7542740.1 ATPase [Peptoniphilaceae bacterium]MDY3076054.1 ATPase [Peptoniphilaceae bacterium]
MDILQLIEELEDVLDDASNIPFSKKVAVDPDEIFEIVKEIRSSLPEEIRQAKWVNDERDRILQEANEQASQLTEQAKNRAAEVDRDAQNRFNELVSEHRITQMATRQAEEMVNNAQQQSRQIREGVFSYIDEVLSNTQENLRTVIAELDHNRSELK